MRVKEQEEYPVSLKVELLAKVRVKSSALDKEKAAVEPSLK